jgi:hypothetical protein
MLLRTVVNFFAKLDGVTSNKTVVYTVPSLQYLVSQVLTTILVAFKILTLRNLPYTLL